MVGKCFTLGILASTQNLTRIFGFFTRTWILVKKRVFEGKRESETADGRKFQRPSGPELVFGAGAFWDRFRVRKPEKILFNKNFGF